MGKEMAEEKVQRARKAAEMEGRTAVEMRGRKAAAEVMAGIIIELFRRRKGMKISRHWRG